MDLECPLLRGSSDRRLRRCAATEVLEKKIFVLLKGLFNKFEKLRKNRWWFSRRGGFRSFFYNIVGQLLGMRS